MMWKKYKQKLTWRKNIYLCAVTKVANELSSWSLSCVNMKQVIALIEQQIRVTNLQANVLQLEGRINSQILGVKR